MGQDRHHADEQHDRAQNRPAGEDGQWAEHGHPAVLLGQRDAEQCGNGGGGHADGVKRPGQPALHDDQYRDDNDADRTVSAAYRSAGEHDGPGAPHQKLSGHLRVTAPYPDQCDGGAGAYQRRGQQESGVGVAEQEYRNYADQERHEHDSAHEREEALAGVLVEQSKRFWGGWFIHAGLFRMNVCGHRRMRHT